MAKQGIGARAPRKEDRRFVTGRGRYVADTIPADALRAAFLRSPHAHAGLTVEDLAEARQLPGVAGVFAGRDLLAEDGPGFLPTPWTIANADGEAIFEPPMTALATDAVRFVGHPCAMAVADSEAGARDAVERIVAHFDERPAAATLEDAMAADAPTVWPGRADNTSLLWTAGDREATGAAFARAAHVVRLSLRNHRIAAMPMEPRVSMARYDPGFDRLTLVTACQLPHELQRALAEMFGLPETKLDVVAPDVGGGFGMKSYVYPEDVALLWAARRLGRDIAWAGDRTEAFLADAGARDHIAHAELALDAEHRFLALRVTQTANMGAYLSQHAPAVPTIYGAFALPGAYRFAAVFAEVRTVFSHSAPIDAYRGAGRSEAVYVTERLIDRAARELGVDPAELRRRNLVRADELPFETALGATLESGDAPRLLDRALERADAAGFPARRAAARAKGRLLGLGIAAYAASCGGCPSDRGAALGAAAGSWESARLQIHPSGAATLFIGTHNHGQGQETSFAQVVSDRTGIDLGRIDVVFGDTRRVQRGMGSFASRSAAVCGPAVALACDRTIERARRIAGHLLEAAADDIALEDGRFVVVGTDRAASFDAVARAAYTAGGFGAEGREPGLDETGFYDPQDFTFPFGAHVAEVAVDEATGEARLTAYAAVDDVGVEINPAIVEGQIHGGVAQGAGQALMEAIRYDRESGQLVTGSFMDYAMPRAADLCALDSERIPSRCSTNPLGVKGAGEIGAFAAPAAVANAVLDALSAAGVTHFDMPATPLRVWRALRAARTR